MDNLSSTGYAQSALKGTFWTYASYYSGKIIVFLSTILLARLLTRDDFGVVGYALVIIGFLDVLSDLGIGPAVVYQRENPRSGSTAFWLGLTIGIVMFGLSWLVAPLAGWYFNDLRAVPVIRVLALTFPISALSNVHSNLLSKALEFRRRFIPDFLRSVAKGIFSVIFALLGFGAWSLVLGQVLGTLATVISYWSVFPWKPAFEFDRAIAKGLLSYGVNVVIVDSLGVLLLNLDYLFIGRFLGAEALGVYSLAFRMPDLLITQFCASVSSVLFPIYVKMREDASSLGNGFLTSMRYVAMVTIPLGLGLMFTARPFVLTFLTDKWVDAIPVIQAIALYATFFSLAYNAGSLYKATGKPYILTRLALVRLAMLVPVLYYAAAVVGNIRAVGYGHALVAFLSGLINLYVAARIVDVRLLDMLVSLRPSAISGLGMVLVLLLVGALTATFLPIIQLLLSMTFGGTTYLVLLVLQQPELIPALRQMALALRRV
jgi:O-antigen/teichoic acid export membrane protein